MRFKELWLNAILFFSVLIVSFLALNNCRHAPATLSPQASQAWYATRVIKTLDLIRDTAVDANAQTPPLLSTETTRRVVEYHRSAIITAHEMPNGWKRTVATGLGELANNLNSQEQTILIPYIHLAQTILNEVIP